MTIPSVDKSAIEQALKTFDDELRHAEEWADWESNKAQSWVLNHNGKRYPPKKIISIATGAPVNAFSGGDESNEYLGHRGFEVGRLRSPALIETFRLILERYGRARASEPFAGNHEIKELFTQSRKLLERAQPVANRSHIRVVASYGKGNWAAIPWVSLLDDRETRTTQDGTYVVYLFREDGQGFYVKLAQGVTLVEKEVGARAADVLAQRATEVRAQCSELAGRGFDLSGRSDLGSNQRIARLYEASTIAAKYYPADAAIDDAELISDIDALLESYDRYVSGRAKAGKVAVDSRRLSLVGTWRGARHQVEVIKKAIEANGAWASPWSFPIKDEALPRLAPPFFLYAYEGDGKLTARLAIAAHETSRGQAGIPSPWQEATNEEWRGVSRSGDRQSGVFKTWFKVTAVEILSPPQSVDDFELAIGLSTPENVLNQNAFGYVIEDKEPEQPEAKTEPRLATVVAPLDIGWLVARTRLKRQFLQELADALLGTSPQVMLAGPPGTSKTHLAQEVALYVTRNRPEQVRLVQFHPGYSYESFIEGIRPVTRAAGVSFELQAGIVCEVVEEMRRTGTYGVAGREHVIVIDEANRANLPRVLGELMYLFEYRGQTIRLQYSDAFALPSNLRFIATMNTADRSIRAIDIALRRRFDVFELRPDADLLAEYYATAANSTVPDLVEGFEALNSALEASLDRHHTIGHAFFMRPQMDGEALAQIWRRKIFPLVEEFFFDQPDQTRSFSIERFWPSALHAPDRH